MKTCHAWLKKIAVAPPAYQGTRRHDRLASAMPNRRRLVKARAARARLRRLAALTNLQWPGVFADVISRDLKHGSNPDTRHHRSMMPVDAMHDPAAFFDQGRINGSTTA